MGSEEAAATANRSEAIDPVRCPVPAQDCHLIGGPTSCASVPCTEAFERQHDFENCGFLARDWPEINSGRPCSSASVRPCDEFLSSVDRRSASSVDLAEVEVVSGHKRANRQDDMTSSLQTPTTASSSSVVLDHFSVEGLHHVDHEMFLSQTYINTGNVCYMISIMTALGWCWCHLPSPRRLGRLHHLLQLLHASKVKILMLDPEYGNAMMHWPSPQKQHDIAELMN